MRAVPREVRTKPLVSSDSTSELPIDTITGGAVAVVITLIIAATIIIVALVVRCRQTVNGNIRCDIGV